MWAFAGGSGTKHECCGRERDQIRYISAGVGQNLMGAGGTEKSVPRRSLFQSIFNKSQYQLVDSFCLNIHLASALLYTDVCGHF